MILHIQMKLRQPRFVPARNPPLNWLRELAILYSITSPAGIIIQPVGDDNGMLAFVCYNHDTADMKLSNEEVRRIAMLTRLGLSEEEVETLSLQLSSILENFEVLKQLDTSEVPPATHTVPLQNVLRKDDVVESYPQADVLSNAPRQAEKCLKVQAILE